MSCDLVSWPVVIGIIAVVLIAAVVIGVLSARTTWRLMQNDVWNRD